LGELPVEWWKGLMCRSTKGISTPASPLKLGYFDDDIFKAILTILTKIALKIAV
jgi:hypothetical protein